MIHVIHFDLNDAKTYVNLSNAISEKLEIKIFYLATPANVFGSISRKLNELNLIDKQTRIVLENPSDTTRLHRSNKQRSPRKF